MLEPEVPFGALPPTAEHVSLLRRRRFDLVGDDLLHLDDGLGEGSDTLGQLLRRHGVLVKLQPERPVL